MTDFTLQTKQTIQAAFQTAVDMLVATDPMAAVNPLQAPLDAANAQVLTLSARLADTNAALAAQQSIGAALIAKIQKAQTDLA